MNYRLKWDGEVRAECVTTETAKAIYRSWLERGYTADEFIVERKYNCGSWHKIDTSDWGVKNHCNYPLYCNESCCKSSK